MLLALLALLTHASSFDEGMVALRGGDAVTARSHLEQAVAANPSYTRAWWELGWAYWKLKDWKGSARAWGKVQELQPGRPDLEQWLLAAQTRLHLSGPATPNPPLEETPRGERTITVVGAGDTMMGTDLRRGVRGLAPNEGIDLFSDTGDLFRSADVAFLNIEGVLADGLPDLKCGDGRPNCYAFRTPTRYTKALDHAGIDISSLANNHAMDLGTAGMSSSMAALDKAGIAHAGRYSDTALIERNGMKIALVAAHSGACCLNVNNVREVTQAIREADLKADLVIFSFHGGAEGSGHRHVLGRTERAWGEYRGDVKKLARAAVDAGADLVLGHGPHVLRAMEVYRGRLVCYSLGNFIGYSQFGTKGGYGGTSLQVEVVLAENGALVKAQLHPLALDSMGVARSDPTGRALNQVRELSVADFPGTTLKVQQDGRLTW